MAQKQEVTVIPECFVDTNLTETLIGMACNHRKGCAMVTKQMKEKCADGFALGIIDKDKRPVPYISEFALIAETESLQILKHKDRNHYIIYVIPAVEGFILKASEELGVNLADYGLPADMDGLKKETKQQDSKKDPRFKRLFTDLLPALNVSLMKSLITYLLEHRFDADVKVIQRMLATSVVRNNPTL